MRPHPARERGVYERRGESRGGRGKRLCQGRAHPAQQREATWPTYEEVRKEEVHSRAVNVVLGESNTETFGKTGKGGQREGRRMHLFGGAGLNVRGGVGSMRIVREKEKKKSNCTAIGGVLRLRTRESDESLPTADEDRASQ